MNKLIFAVALLFSSVLFCNAQQSFKLPKNAKEGQIIPLDYNGFTNGYVIYSHEEKNGVYSYTFNIFNKEMVKTATKKYPLSRGSEVYQVLNNKSTFCFVTGNSEKNSVDIFTYDMKGKRVGKKAINKNTNARIAKVVKAMQYLKEGEDLKGMDLFMPKVVAAENGYYLSYQNIKTKEGYILEKCNNKLRKEWEKSILPDDKEIISFGSVKEVHDKIALLSVQRDKLTSKSYNVKLSVLDKEEDEPIYTYDLEEEGDILSPDQMLMEEDGSLILAGNYLLKSRNKSNEPIADGVFVLKLDDDGEQDYVSLISWDDEMKNKVSKSDGDINYFTQAIIKQNRTYDLVVETYEINFKQDRNLSFGLDDDDDDKKGKKKKNKGMDLPTFPFCKSRDILVLKTDHKSGTLNNVYAVKKESNSTRMPTYTPRNGEAIWDIKFKNPQYLAYKFSNVENDFPYFVYYEVENDIANFNATTLRSNGKPSTRTIKFSDDSLLDSFDKCGVFQTDTNMVVVYNYDNDSETFQYWKDNISKTYRDEQLKKERQAAFEAQLIKKQEEAKALAKKEMTEKAAAKKAKEAMETKKAVNHKKETAKKINTTQKVKGKIEETKSKSAIKNDEDTKRAERIALLKKKLEAKRKEREAKEKMEDE